MMPKSHRILTTQSLYLNEPIAVLENIIKNGISFDELQKVNEQDQKHLNQFLTSKKALKAQETLSFDRRSIKIKKFRHPKKIISHKSTYQSWKNQLFQQQTVQQFEEQIVQDNQGNLQQNLDYLLLKYTNNNIQILQDQITHSVQNIKKTKQINTIRELFLNTVKYLSDEYTKLQNQFTTYLQIQQDHLYFQHFRKIRSQLPRQFLAIIYQKFPTIKDFLANFDKELLQEQYQNHRKNLNINFIQTLLENPFNQRWDDEDDEDDIYDEEDFQTKQAQLQNNSLDNPQINNNSIDILDISTCNSTGKKKKKKKRKNKKKKCEKEDIIKNQELDKDNRQFNELIKVLESLNINYQNDNRLPCNVTNQWLLKYKDDFK